MSRTSRVIALALTFTGAAGFLLPAAPRLRAGVRRTSWTGESADASCLLETELGVIAANNAFYNAFCGGDLDAMGAIWHPAEGECSLILPGQRPVFGRHGVLSSWQTVLGSPTQIEPSDTTVICAAGEVAWVHCLINVRVCRVAASSGDGDDMDGQSASWERLMKGEDEDVGDAEETDASTVQAQLAATNVFKRDETGAWKVVAHQAGPCA